MRTIALTIDVEPDCPPYLRTYRGIESGLPALLEVLEKYDVKATFFITGDVASKHPQEVAKIARRYEIGCHGYSHKRFDRMIFEDAVDEIEKSTAVLRRLAGRVISFRAPNLIFPERFLGLLKDNGYLIDSSLAKYKIGHLYRIYAGGKDDLDNGLLRIPVSATSSMLRLPIGNGILRRLDSPVVLFFHPWEFVDMSGEPVRWDCKINTGSRALARLGSLIGFFKKSNYRFCTISDFLEL
jgi:peptidoglycan/xylan/chitin deacetylase (PgdA/CDA1 family)